jgi:hypothetical protein
VIRYRAPPEWGTRGTVEATGKDIHRFAKAVRKRLVSVGVPVRDCHDLAQEVEVITWRAVEEERIGEVPGRSAANVLLGFMLETAFRAGCNYVRLRRHRYERLRERLGGGEDAVGAAGDPVARMEAREILDRLRRRADAEEALATGFEAAAKMKGAARVAAYARARKVRRWLREVCEAGVWVEPPGGGARGRKG